MRIKVEFKVNNVPLYIPLHSYNHILQSVIYRLSPNTGFHDGGFFLNTRKYKPFTFSRLMGQFTYDKENKKLIFKNTILKWVIASTSMAFLKEISYNLLEKGVVSINGYHLKVYSIGPVIAPPIFSSEKSFFIRMLSPMTVYITPLMNSNEKYYIYLSPFDTLFAQKIKESLQRKYTAFYNKSIPDAEFEIVPYSVRKRVIHYKGSLRDAWEGVYRIGGTPELVELAYNCGLGTNTSYGLGCFEIIGEANIE